MSAFENIANFFGSGGAGVLVTLVLGLEAYLRDRKKIGREATLRNYIEWLRRKEHKELMQGQQKLINALQAGDEQSSLLEDYVQRIMSHIKGHSDILRDIRVQIDKIANVDQKLDLVLSKISSIEPPVIPKGQLLVSAKVLDFLSSAAKGSGIRVLLKHKGNTCKAGSLMVGWLLGEKSPNMMLADYVGGINENRLSTILNPDGSVSLRAYDSLGKEICITSASYANAEFIMVIAVWETKRVSLWVNGRQHGSANMSAEFDYLGPLLLFGLDIEGKLSADAVRWAPKGSQPGLNFQKNGIWHESRYDFCYLFERILTDAEIRTLSDDPYVMFRLRPRDSQQEIKAVSERIEADPSNAYLYFYRAETWNGMNQWEKAISDCDKAIRLNPLLGEAYVSRGIAQMKCGQYERALTDFDEAIRLRSKNTRAHNSRGWLLATCPNENYRDGTRAIRDALKACELNSWGHETLDTLAVAYAEAGQFTKAIEWQEKAIDIAPEKNKAELCARLELYKAGLPYREEAPPRSEPKRNEYL